MSTSKKAADGTSEICFQYEQMLKTVPSLLYVIDKKERLIQANPAVLALLGVETCEQLTGTFYEGLAQSKWLDPRVHSLRQTDLEVLVSEVAQYKVEEPPLTDLRGVVFYYEATRVPLINLKGHVVGLIVHLMDVTPRKMLEAQLRGTSEEQGIRKRVRPFPPSVHRDPSQPPHFLVIEDALPAQEAIRMVLNDLGCKAEFASTDAEFEQLFKIGKYDIVFMDIGLEGTSGYLLAKRIRQLEHDSGYCVPIIALTGYDAELVKTDCDHYFMEGAITKPLSSDQARQIIQYYVYDTPVSIRGMVSLKQQP